jgi:hypothetical protein
MAESALGVLPPRAPRDATDHERDRRFGDPRVDPGPRERAPVVAAAKLGEPELERREMMDTRRDAVEVAAHNVDLDRVQVASRHRGREIDRLAEG